MGSNIVLPVRDLAPGTYHLRITCGVQRWSRAFVKD